MKSNILNVMIIDNEKLYHQAYRYYFEKYRDYCLVGLYASVEDALKDFTKIQPDIIVSEVFTPQQIGLQGIRAFRKKDRHVKIIMSSNQTEFDLVKKAFKNGAHGYITKPVSKKRLLQALNSIKYEGATMSNDIIQKVISNFHQKNYVSFSDRENQIIDYLCSGATYKLIADKLYITPSAVNFHIQNIYLKLNVNSKSEALLKLQEMD
ncbi:response regulator transcription factor [Arenibacter sp. GZD96]|uniref:response regulator transcription factor n=1 Tax=Aurantibrevibacter litoralis TaxID=3106030 RepID=UPI002AFF6258|nr:response regulator transcription factor [Arenibacter sp. GZD-96]MEA1785825.1 response regulator transcription factor [Arenibacter sp. GZD-96]